MDLVSRVPLAITVKHDWNTTVPPIEVVTCPICWALVEESRAYDHGDWHDAGH